jgi:hypothetical protein
MIKNLPEGHIIDTMIKEHHHILNILDELNDISRELSIIPIENTKKLLIRINTLSLKLINAEPHHQREEQVLFPALEKEGIMGATSCMRKEHESIRLMKNRLKNKTMTIDMITKSDIINIMLIINDLCDTLRLHIEKENTILYPFSLQKINDDAVWVEMKKQCDDIGYCCFHPVKEAVSI